MDNRHLKTTVYCDHEHHQIKYLAEELAQNNDDKLHFVKEAFFYVRDEVRFGADLWQVKASDTLKKKYGACYNKNLLLMAILRNQGIECALSSNPMSRTFCRPCIGQACKTFSNPFQHCFTRVWVNNRKIDIDPTLDKRTFEAFFKPAGVKWSVDWNDSGMPPLYEESISGAAEFYDDIDNALNSNLESWYIFKHEPALLLRFWLWLGNVRMWKTADRILHEKTSEK